MQTSLVTWTTKKINDGLLLQAQRTWRSTQLGCQEAGHSCSFFIRSRRSGYGSSSSRSIVSETSEDFDIQQKHPIAIGEDNQSCIELCQHPVIHKRRKHIETKIQFIRDKTEDGTISIHYITFLLTKWQPTSSQNLYPYQRWKQLELFWWEQLLRNQLKSEWGC